MRIAISTGGGDAPGLNAVIRAVVLAAHHRGWQVYGIQRGYDGLLTFNGVVPLAPEKSAASPTSAAPSSAPPTAAIRSAMS